MDMNSEYICHTCLSLDRRLYPLTNFVPLIQLNFLPTTAKMCWECGNMVLKFSNFITKAVTAQGILMDVQHNDNIVCLSTLEFSKHQPLYEFEHIDSDKISEPDSEETISVKEEVFSSDTENEMYQEDTEQINYNTHDDDDEENSEKDDKSNLNIEMNFDIIKVETENSQQKPEITWTKKRETLLDAENRFSDVPEDVMKKISVTELTDEEVLNKREQKRRNLQKFKYKCDFCITGFTTQANLTKHMRSMHKHIDYNDLNAPGDELRDCDICKRRFRTKHLARKHRKHHYIEYKCRLCQYRAYKMCTIVTHCQKNHDKEPVGQTVCDLCPVMSFKNPEEYFRHWQLYHGTCEICGHTSRKKNSLQRHMKRMHSHVEKFICDHCSKGFTSKSALEIHMCTHDANIAKALSYCDICNIHFKRVQTYRTHLKLSANHVKERIKCSECDKQFVTEYTRRKHYNFYHLKKSEYKCEECDKMFISKGNLMDHKRIHHGLKIQRNYECNDCGKKFYSSTILKKHYLVHSDLRELMCSECGDTFKHSGALYTHTKLVHRLGNKLYKKQKKIEK